MAVAPLSIVLIAFAYFLGSIPCGLIITRMALAEDVRAKGSGNIGATNVLRVAGKAYGALTLLGDISKGALPVFLSVMFAPESTLYAAKDITICCTALAAVGGHLYPVYLKGKTGGKGVATALGCFLVIAPAAAGLSFIIFMLAVWRFRYVSIGSLSAALTLPIFSALFGHSSSVIVTMLIVSAFIFLKHRANLKRLRNGTEPTI